MEKSASHILDIHTHKSEKASRGKAIINCRWLPGASLCVVGGGSADRAADMSTDRAADISADIALEEGYFYSAGIHPWDLAEEYDGEEQLRLLRALFANQQLIAVGEAGLDKLAAAPMEFQIEMFEKQVMLSEDLRLPLIIHCVKAMEELLAVKKKLHPAQPWIWHGFRGKPEQAVQLIKNSIYLSFGVHYPERTLNAVPLERLFLETDDSPVEIEDVLRKAAKVRGVGEEKLRPAIAENIQKVFFKG